jgi:DNA mismatch repair protein MutH
MTKIVTRQIAIENLKKYIGKDLRELALEFGITTYETGKQNKGWKGLVLERLAGLTNNNEKAPNGLSYELKSVAFYEVQDELVPKETMAITMINPKELVEHSFFESHCWAKLKSLIVCAVGWTGKNAEGSILLNVTSMDFVEDADLIKEVEADYEYIRKKLIEEGFKALTGKDGKWIQARTKGPGHGSISRAFYARKLFIKKIFEEAK